MLSSPAINRLTAAVAAGDTAAVDTFWAEVAACGTPLVEPADDAQHRLVTFLWRDDGATRNVVVVGGPAVWDPVEADQMTRLPGTDVWHRTYRAPADLFGRYFLSPNDSLEAGEGVTDWQLREQTFRADPLNPMVIDWPANPADPTAPAQSCSLLALPDAPSDAAAGTAPRRPLASWTQRSDVLGNERTVWLYLPPGADEATSLPLVVLLDGWVWAEGRPVAGGLDRLVTEARLAPVAVVMVDSLDDGTRNRELECHPQFLAFLIQELLPEVQHQAPAGDAAGRVTIAGQSLGGLCAAYAAFERPDVFGHVVSQSGSFWSERDTTPDRAEWLTARYLSAPVRPVTFDLTVGRLEGEEMLSCNRRLRDALLGRGYNVHYGEYSGGHDWVAWRVGLLDALARAHPATMSGAPSPPDESRPS